MTGTYAVDAYLRGGVDRPAASGTRINAVATTSTTTNLHLPPQLPVTQRTHNNKNSHHELAPQQEHLGQGWEEIRNKTSLARVVVARLGGFVGRGSRRKTSASGRPRSSNQQCGKVFTYNRADLAAGKKKYIFTKVVFGKVHTEAYQR